MTDKAVNQRRHTRPRLLTGALSAVLLSVLAFWMLVTPQAPRWLGWPLVSILSPVLDAPVSALNMLLPGQVRSPFAIQFRGYSTCCPRLPAVELAHYAAIGAPAYLALLGALHLFVRLMARLLQRHARHVAQP